MPARTQELKIGQGFHRQTNTGTKTMTPSDLQTALSSVDLWNLLTSAFNVPFPDLQSEDDSAFFGKGDEWIEQTFPTSIDAPWTHNCFLTSQNFAQMICFGLGAITETSPASGAHQYIVTPMDPPNDGVNLPATTIVGAIRQGTADEILDMALVGAVLDSFTIRIQKGPGLQNTSITANWKGCGRHIINSGITVPDKYIEKRVGAGAATSLMFGGVDYFANARFVDFEYTFNNNVVDGHFPGSGQQSGYDIQGRMRFGRRSQSLIYTVELESDSPELGNLASGAENPTSLIMTGPLITGSTHHKVQLDFPRTTNKTITPGDSDGFTVIKCTANIMKGTDGPCTLTAITDKAGIGADA